MIQVCPLCDGTGQKPTDTSAGFMACNGCFGRGLVSEQDLPIPTPIYPAPPWPSQPGPYQPWVTWWSSNSDDLSMPNICCGV